MLSGLQRLAPSGSLMPILAEPSACQANRIAGVDPGYTAWLQVTLM
jgi:hypothetical protein